MPSQSAASLSNFVQINGNVVSAASSGYTPQLLVLTQNPIIPTGTVLQFNSTSAVFSYFGNTTNPSDTTAKLYIDSNNAGYYFSGSLNKGSGNPPSSILFYYYAEDNTSAWTRGTALSLSTDLLALQSVTAGTLNMTYNGTTYAATGVNLSSSTSFTAMAGVIETRVQAVSGLSLATVTFDSITNAFTVTFPFGGANTVGYITASDPGGTDQLADKMKITATLGGMLSQGLSAQSPADVMNAVINITSNFAMFTCNFDINSDSTYAIVNGLTAWNLTINNGKSFLPFYYDTKSGAQTPITNPMQLSLIASGYGQSTVKPNSMNTTMMLITTNNTANGIGLPFATSGLYASINFDAQNGMLTGNAAQFSGITPIITNNADLNLLLNEFGMNSYINLQSRANSFQWFETGVIGGSYLWADTFIGYTWINDQCQVAIANLMQSLNSIPYNNLSVINSVLTPIFQQGLNNGAVQTNITLDATEKAELIAQAGYDFTSILYNQGYYIPLITASATDITNRTLSSVNAWYTYGGGVVTVTMNLTTVI